LTTPVLPRYRPTIALESALGLLQRAVFLKPRAHYMYLLYCLQMFKCRLLSHYVVAAGK